MAVKETPAAPAAPASEPAAAAPVVAAAEPVVAAPAVTEAAPAAPAVVAAPAEPAGSGDIPTLLEEFGAKAPDPKPAGPKAPEPKPGEAKPGDPKAVDPKAVDPKGAPAKAADPAAAPAVAEAVVAAPIAWDLKFPETIKASATDVDRLTGILNDIARPKEGVDPSTAASQLLALHSEQMIAYDKQLRAEQQTSFNNYRAEQRKLVLADPDIGGAGHDTAMKAIARARDALISDAKPGSAQYQKDAAAFSEFLRYTGSGDHRIFLNILHRAARFVDEPAAPTALAKPTSYNGAKTDKAGTLYSNRT